MHKFKKQKRSKKQQHRLAVSLLEKKVYSQWKKVNRRVFTVAVGGNLHFFCKEVVIGGYQCMSRE